MITKLQKWGNSQGVRIPKQFLMLASFREGDEIEIIAESDKIVIRRPEKLPKKYKIEELFVDYDAGQKTTEEDWGAPSGKEVW